MPNGSGPDLVEKLKAEGQSILLIDKNLGAVMRLADRHVIIKNGINMTGMPSFELAGAKDDEIWSIAALPVLLCSGVSTSSKTSAEKLESAGLEAT